MPIDLGGHFVKAELLVAARDGCPLVRSSDMNVVLGRGRAALQHAGCGMEGRLVHPPLGEFTGLVGVFIAQRAHISLPGVCAFADIIPDGERPKLGFGGVVIPVPGPDFGGVGPERLFGFIREPGFDLDPTVGGRGEPLDADSLVELAGPGGELERIGAVHGAVGTEIKKGAGAELDGPHITEDRLQLVEVAIVIAHKFAPPLSPLIKIIEGQDAG